MLLVDIRCESKRYLCAARLAASHSVPVVDHRYGLSCGDAKMDGTAFCSLSRGTFYRAFDRMLFPGDLSRLGAGRIFAPVIDEKWRDDVPVATN